MNRTAKMKLLDYFAGQYLSSLDGETNKEYSNMAERVSLTPEEMIAHDAYNQAEAMLIEREKREREMMKEQASE